MYEPNFGVGYGGNYYGDGGGFMSGSQVGGGSQGSPSGGRVSILLAGQLHEELILYLKKTRNPNQSLRAITIRQIYMAEQTHSDAEFVIDGAETTQVCFMRNIYITYINDLLNLDHTRGSGGRGDKTSHQHYLQAE